MVVIVFNSEGWLFRKNKSLLLLLLLLPHNNLWGLGTGQDGVLFARACSQEWNAILYKLEDCSEINLNGKYFHYPLVNKVGEE